MRDVRCVRRGGGVPLACARGTRYRAELHSQGGGEPLDSESDSERRTISVMARDSVYSSETNQITLYSSFYRLNPNKVLMCLAKVTFVLHLS